MTNSTPLKRTRGTSGDSAAGSGAGEPGKDASRRSNPGAREGSSLTSRKPAPATGASRIRARAPSTAAASATGASLRPSLSSTDWTSAASQHQTTGGAKPRPRTITTKRPPPAPPTPAALIGPALVRTTTRSAGRPLSRPAGLMPTR